ncbi:MAG: hypothetical protein ACRDST_02225 [Pseudonocardiaceae bacterium]
MPAPEEMSRDELITLVTARDAEITAMAGQQSELMPPDLPFTRRNDH